MVNAVLWASPFGKDCGAGGGKFPPAEAAWGPELPGWFKPVYEGLAQEG